MLSKIKKTSKSRLDLLRQLLVDGKLSTQEELVEKLHKSQFPVTQSTVSRDLRKLGAVRAIDNEGRTVYKLPDEVFAPINTSSLNQMVTSIRSNGALIVIRTHPGSASLVGRFVDINHSDEILGCIAGDDTVFVAPHNSKNISVLMKKLIQSLQES